jgi:hypothetical protein
MHFRKSNYLQFNYLFFLLLFLAGCNTSQTSDEKVAADTASLLQKQDTLISAVPDSVSTSATSLPATKKSESPKASPASADNLSFTIIQGNENTFGYDIYKDSRLIIHQANIPAVSGNKGFETKELAESVALLVIEKVSKGEMPPTVSIEELKNLGVNISK